MDKNNPAIYECEKGRDGFHVWKRNPDRTATCVKCKLVLTVEQANDCFDSSHSL